MINSRVSMKSLISTFLVSMCLSAAAFGQQTNQPKSTVILPTDKQFNVAEKTNLYCAGYIQKSPVNTDFEVVGADSERDKNIFAEGDMIYVSRGASSGVKVGDMYAVIRPRGQFSSKFSDKGKLGIYVQEVGAVEIVNVKGEVSVARVRTSCDNLLLGDLLQPMPQRTSPVFTQRPALDPYAEASGKTKGRIVMARDSREALSSNLIVYIDLGAEDNVQVGDYLTIYRPLGKRGIVKVPEENLSARESGFQSDKYSGGKFSNQAPRKEGNEAKGNLRTSEEAKANRPAGLRNVLGEMVILNVKERTATALITRNTQEIFTGDMVEVQ